MDSLILNVIILGATWIVKRLITSPTATKNAPYPPGPRSKFIVGNMFDFPRPGTNAAQTYIRWGELYKSDILHASALGNHVIVLNNREDVEEMFKRRSAKYSDRPFAPIIPMIGWQYNLVLLPHGNEWREHRKLCQKNFSHESAHIYQPVQIKKVHKMLEALSDSPDKFDDHIKMLAVSIPMAMMYGYDVESTDDPCIAAADRSTAIAAQLLVPGGSMINILPFLRHVPTWVPGASSHKQAAEVKRLTEEMVRIPTDLIKLRMKEGTAPSSLVSDFMQKKETVGASEYEEFVVNQVGCTVYLAAGDTSMAAIRTLFYALAVHPDAQQKAQTEIDRVFGPNPARLPQFSDRALLPYVEAMYREIMRWRPPTPLGVAHRCAQDDHYKGYFIPEGATVFANIWAMAHNEAVYPEPDTFNPERFFDEHGQLNGDDQVLSYGFGRRACVGKYVASSTLWLVLVSVLSCFDIRKAKDEFGKEIDIPDEYGDYGLVNHKKAFVCAITPRSAHSIRLVKETCNF